MLGYELSLKYGFVRTTDSKAEQGNDNLIACDGNGNSTATENYSTMSITI